MEEFNIEEFNIGIIIAVIAVMAVVAFFIYSYLKNRSVITDAKEVDYLKYYDFKELLYDSQIASYLKEHPNHRLIARKKNVIHNGKNMIYIKTYYFDKLTKEDIEMDNPLVLISEKMNDELEYEFGSTDIIFVEKTFYWLDSSGNRIN